MTGILAEVARRAGNVYRVLRNRAVTANRRAPVGGDLSRECIERTLRSLSRAGWEGTATQLLAEMRRRTSGRLPASGSHISRMVREMVPSLRQRGIGVDFFIANGRSDGRRRMIQIHRIPGAAAGR